MNVSIWINALWTKCGRPFAGLNNKVSQINFWNRCIFLRAQLKAIGPLIGSGLVLFAVTVFVFPKLPMFISALYEEWSLLRVVLCIYETYLYPVAMGTILTSNVLLFITYRSVAGCIAALSEELKQNDARNFVSIESVARKYFYLQILVGRLNSVFSASLMFLEYVILVAIGLTIFGPSRIVSENSTVLSIFFYFLATEFAASLVVQFYPMILLNMNSNEFLYLARSFPQKSKFAQLAVVRCRKLKVRPMGLHTVTVSTLNDYVVFVVSLVLMLNGA